MNSPRPGWCLGVPCHPAFCGGSLYGLGRPQLDNLCPVCPAPKRRRPLLCLSWKRGRVAQDRLSFAAQAPATLTQTVSADLRRPAKIQDQNREFLPSASPFPARLACATKLEKRFPLRAPRSRPSLEAPPTSLLRRSPRGLPSAAALSAPGSACDAVPSAQLLCAHP